MSHDKEVVRIRVKKCDGMKQPEYKKMCVDPQITSFNILQCLLVRAFHIKSDFTISYLATDDDGSDVYLSMLSDWDLDAAIFSSSSPYLCLKVDLKPFEDSVNDEWDVVKLSEPTNPTTNTVTLNNKAFSKTINSFFEKTVQTVTKAIGFKQDDISSSSSAATTTAVASSPTATVVTKHNHQPQLPPLPPPLSDSDFRSFQNPVGCLVEQNKFRLTVYQGGVEGSLRKVVWRHLLNVYPHHMTGKERIDYLNSKSKEYYNLRDGWKRRLMEKKMSVEDKQVIGAVKKDVLRTDRHHAFFAGKDDNSNSISLLNLLVTYSLTHPDLSYCQGMSDLASPLLVIQKDEPSAYICFCSLMQRLRDNFSPDGKLIMGKFEHLTCLLEHHDLDFARHLRRHRIGPDLFFCYRWILLEMKREFPLDDAMLVLEIMWSTLPITAPSPSGVPLVDDVFVFSSPSSLSSPPPKFSIGYLNLKKNRIPDKKDNSNSSASGSYGGGGDSCLPTASNTTSAASFKTKKGNCSNSSSSSSGSSCSSSRNNSCSSSCKCNRSSCSCEKIGEKNNCSVDEKEVLNEDVPDVMKDNKSKLWLNGLNKVTSEDFNINDYQTTTSTSISDSNNKNSTSTTTASIVTSNVTIITTTLPATTQIRTNATTTTTSTNTTKTHKTKNQKKKVGNVHHHNPQQQQQQKLNQRSEQDHHHEDHHRHLPPAHLLNIRSPCDDMITSITDVVDVNIEEYLNVEKTCHDLDLCLAVDDVVANSNECDNDINANNSNNNSSCNSSSCTNHNNNKDNNDSDGSINNCSTSTTDSQQKKASSETFSIDLTTKTSTAATKPITKDLIIGQKTITTSLPSLLSSFSLQSTPEKKTMVTSTTTLSTTSISTTSSFPTSTTTSPSKLTTTVPTTLTSTTVTTMKTTSTTTKISNSPTSSTTMMIIKNIPENNNKNETYASDDEYDELASLLKNPEVLPPLKIEIDERTHDNDGDNKIDTNHEEEVKPPLPLPPPQEMGCGNAFLMFLCLSLLLTHRDHIMKNNMDYNDTAMYYDRKVRKHDAVKVIVHAKSLYSAYLKNQLYKSKKE